MNDLEGDSQYKIDFDYKSYLAWIVVIIALVLTVVSFLISFQSAKEYALEQFHAKTEDLNSAIIDRLYIYEQVLRSGVGLIYASDKIQRKDFAHFVKTLDINHNWPGIQGIGYSIPIKPEEKEAHIKKIREEGFPDFTIKPEGKRDMYSSIIYLEPFDWRNQRAFGYDMWSNDTRREAMKSSLDNGDSAISGIITLVQETDEDIQSGFLMYLPVYKNKTIPKTISERQEQFQGWIYAPFRSRDFIDAILKGMNIDFDFEIFDGTEMSQETLLFDSNNSLHLTDSINKPIFERRIELDLPGRTWTVYFHTSSDFYKEVELTQPLFIAITGVVVDLLLFYIIYAYYATRRQAYRMAEEMTEEMKRSKEVLEIAVKERTQDLERAQVDLENKVRERTQELKRKMNEMRRFNESIVGRELRMRELKNRIRELERERDQGRSNE